MLGIDPACIFHPGCIQNYPKLPPGQSIANLAANIGNVFLHFCCVFDVVDRSGGSNRVQISILYRMVVSRGPGLDYTAKAKN